MRIRSDTHAYCARYCEENVWHLIDDSALADARLEVVFVSNAERAVALWQQRATSEGPILWDYHVFLLRRSSVRWDVLDLDCRLGCPIDADVYLEATFGLVSSIPTRFHPSFRVVPASIYKRELNSDRSHMRRGHTWLSPPPPWPEIRNGSVPNLMRFVDLERPFLGAVHDLACLRRFLAADP